MSKPKRKSLAQHRPNAGIVLFNEQGKVLLCHRKGAVGALTWQFPQGGIDKGEKPLTAALRELTEETGIKPKHVRKLGKTKGWLSYDFPADATIAPSKRRKWKGQKQKWFAMRFLGTDKHIRLNKHKPQEFDKYLWVELADAPFMVIEWKRHVYEELVCKFERFAAPVYS